MKERRIETRRGVETRLLEFGDARGRPLLYFHCAGGLLPEEPLLELLGGRFRVLAPEWPGYGESTGDELLEDMLDFALHGLDLLEALELDVPPVLVGHSMGGMIAGEMACLNPHAFQKLVLLAPAGLWMDAHPIPDLFAMLPFQMAQALFHDPAEGMKLMMQGMDFSNLEALQDFLVGNARRLGMAGKILFPIPNRRLAKRLYRLMTPSLLVWGRSDRLIPPPYAERWVELVPGAELVWIEEAGHMAPYEQPAAVAEALQKFLG
jgi:pimeloyl-ACP methyl ester carboxylesterase